MNPFDFTRTDEPARIENWKWESINILIVSCIEGDSTHQALLVDGREWPHKREVQTGTEEYVIETIPVTDEEGNQVYDENGDPVMQEVIGERPVYRYDDVFPFAEVMEARSDIKADRPTKAQQKEKDDKEKAKQDRAKKLASANSLTVEVDGMVFQANELSRQRMADAILASDFLQQTDTVWRLADDSQQTVTLTQLREAHAKALQAFGALIIE